MCLISVCIPTYESARLLSRAISSVLAQKKVNFEIIIGDNASTDDTFEVVSSFNDDRIRYFRHTHNIGYPSNVNFCLDKAKGEYVCILCADDFYIHDEVLNELKSPLEARIDIVASYLPFELYLQSNDKCARTGKPSTPLGRGFNNNEDVLLAFSNGTGCFGWCWMLRNSAIASNLRFETDHDMAPDTMFWLDLSFIGPIFVCSVSRAGYAFVMHPESLGGQMFDSKAMRVFSQLVEFEDRLFTKIETQNPKLYHKLRKRKYRYSTSEFSGLVQKAFTEQRTTRYKSFELLFTVLLKNPRALNNWRFVRNTLFIFLPKFVRNAIIRARKKIN